MGMVALNVPEKNAKSPNNCHWVASPFSVAFQCNFATACNPYQKLRYNSKMENTHRRMGVFRFLVCIMDLNPWVLALRKQSGRLFLAKDDWRVPNFIRNWVAKRIVCEQNASRRSSPIFIKKGTRLVPCLFIYFCFFTLT